MLDSNNDASSSDSAIHSDVVLALHGSRSLRSRASATETGQHCFLGHRSDRPGEELCRIFGTSRSDLWFQQALSLSSQLESVKGSF